MLDMVARGGPRRLDPPYKTWGLVERAEPIAEPPFAEPIVPALALAAEPPPPLAVPLSAERPIPTEPTPSPTIEVPIVLLSPTGSRRLAESLILFICAILFLRAMAVEPFGVPTGSMSPTLIGNHKCVNCPRCGYPIRVGEPGKNHNGYPRTFCPNCGMTDINLNGAIELAGDRLLVDKNVYTIRSPRRWEPAVFRCPSDMTKPYVKRVIGRPREKVFIQDGDIWIDDHLARKTLSECRESRVPIFDMNYPPQPDGWVKRWSIESKLPPEAGDQQNDPTLILADRELRLDGSWATRVPVWVSYKHHRYDEATEADKEEVIRDGFVYNGTSAENNAMPVHDFFLEFEVEIIGGSGTLHCRLFDGQDKVIALCPIGHSQPEVQLKHDGFGVIRSAERKQLQEKKKYRIEMAFVDRRVSFAVDGREAVAAYDLEPARNRPDVTSPVAIGVQGVNVIIRDVKIYRDIYYRSSGKNAVDEPLVLGPDEYFMLGDNSANSDDSRSWPIPGVPERNFLGKPFLLHQPSRVTHLTVGGRERIFQSIDWSRIRFLR